MRGVTQKPVPADHTESTRLRLTFLTLLVVSLFVLIFGRLWFLQVMAGERYEALAAGNAERTISIEAPRGKILDRDGDVLVENRYVYVVSVQLSEMGNRQRRVLRDLADLLGTTPKEIRKTVVQSTVSPVRPKPIAVDVPEDIIFYIWENQSTRYPGVYAELLPRREYPHGDLASHIVGYLGEINAEQLEQPEYEDYDLGDQIGLAGVERTYEYVLRGQEGVRRLEVDASGEVLGQIGEDLPKPGSDLRLTIDLEAQQLAEQALRNGLERARQTEDHEDRSKDGYFEAPAGAVVVMDPDNGAIRAMVSLPQYEPARFVGGVSHEYYDWLGDKRNHYPLINRAVQSSYPPGSVFKVVTAAAAMRHGFMNAGDTLPCPPAWEWNGSVYRNWYPGDMGALNLSEALVHSCDTVFYELAQLMWTREQNTGAEQEFLTDEARRWGFGRVQGVDLPSERDGVVPGREWRREYWKNARDTYCAQAKTATDPHSRQLFTELCSEEGAAWRGGDAVNMSIGQGDTQTTPLQMASAYAAIANGGTLYRPHVGGEIVRRNGKVKEVTADAIGDLNLGPEQLAILRSGLRGVTAEGGTAGAVFGDFPLDVAGKTGTAELKPKQPFAWFAAYAPVEDPEHVVVALLEEGGGGSQTAAPIVKEILAGLYDIEADIGVGEATD